METYIIYTYIYTALTYTIHHTPYTIHHTPYTVQGKAVTAKDLLSRSMSVTVDSKDAKLIGGGYRGALTRVGLHQARRMGECIMCGAVCYMVLYGAVWCCVVMGGAVWCDTDFLSSLPLSLPLSLSLHQAIDLGAELRERYGEFT